MAWVLLVLAGILEVVWAYSMKLSDGFTKVIPTSITVGMMIASVGLLSISMLSIPLGTAYSIWTGIGAIGTFIVGIIALGEQASLLRIFAALLIVSGLVLMKLSSSN